VVGQREAGAHGGPVDFEAVGETAQVGQVDGAGGRDPLGEFHVVARSRFQQGGEAAYEIGECGHLRAGRGDLLQQGRFLRTQVFGVGEQEAAGVTWGGDGAVAFSAALVEVADPQVGAAGVAQLSYLPQQLGDSNRRIGRATGAQMVAVGIDEGGPVGGGDAQGLGFGHAGIAFDRVQGQAQVAGAVEQADALAEEVVDLVPAFAGGLLAYSAGAGRVDGGPASGVCPDLEQDFVAEISPEVPSVADLHRVGQGAADGLGVGGGAVAAHDLDTRMFAQPGLQGGRVAVGQDRDASAGFGIRDDRGVAVAAAQGEIVHADHPWDGLLRQRQASQMAQCGTAGNGHGQQAGEACGRPAA
jgi:hypothetical protein